MRISRTATFTGLAALAIGNFAAAAGDATKGLEIFKQRCGVCHSTEATGGPILGPNLRGVVGRKAGSQPDFRMYSSALSASKLTWDLTTLDSFLIAPMTTVPGTTMPMTMLNNDERADVIAFLASLKK